MPDILLKSDGTWREVGGDSNGGTGCFVIILIILYCSGAFDRCSCIRCGYGNSNHTYSEQVLLKNVIGYTTVKVSTANLRKGPGAEYDYYSNSIGKKVQLNRGHQLDVLEDINGWLRIIAPDGGTAYIKKSLCSKIKYNEEDKEVESSESNNSNTIEEDSPSTIVSPSTEVCNITNNNVVETRPNGLINAKLNYISCNNGILRVKMLITTSMVRRQFRVTGSKVRDKNGEFVNVSDVSISGLEKSGGYLILTDRNGAYLTIVIPEMPDSGSLSEISVYMSLSGTQEWATVKNVSW